MADPFQGILVRLDPQLRPGDAARLARMAAYLDRHSLPLVRIEEGRDGPVLVFGSPASCRLRIGDLLALHARLSAGERIDWTRLAGG